MVYKDVTSHKIAELSTECFGVCSNTNSEFRANATLKGGAKENGDSNKTRRCVHDPLLYQI
jgi:hypothetical protein